MTLQRMDNVLIVVDDLEAAKSFFVELGMELDVSRPDHGTMLRPCEYKDFLRGNPVPGFHGEQGPHVEPALFTVRAEKIQVEINACNHLYDIYQHVHLIEVERS